MLPPILLGLLTIAILTLVGAGLGRRLLRLLGCSGRDPIEHGLLALSLGLGTLAYLPFGMFALGVGHPASVRITFVVLAVLLLPDIVSVVRAAVKARLSIPAGWPRAMAGLFVIFLLSLLVRGSAPVEGGDALSYHLTAAFRYLIAGRFVYIPTVTPTNWPLGVEMLYALITALDPTAPTSVAHFLLGLVTVGWMLWFAYRLGGRAAAGAALALLMMVNGQTYQGVFHLMTVNLVDVGTAAYLTPAIVCMHRVEIEGGDRTRLLTLSAILTGLAATTKVTGLWAIVTMTIVLFIAELRARRPGAIGRAIGYGLIATLVTAPWYVKTWILTGNPVYPMFSSILGGRDLTPTSWALYERAHLILNAPPFFKPTDAVLHATHLFNSVIGLLIAAWSVRATRGSRLAVPLTAAGIFTASICIGSYVSLRFLTAIFPVLAACVASRARGHERTVGPIATLAVGVVTALVLFGKPGPTVKQTLAVSLGLESRDTYLRRMMPDYPVILYANAHLPENGRLLVGTFEYNLAPYKMMALWPDYWLQDSIHYDSQARLESDLRRLGVGYLVLKTEFPDYCARSYYCKARMDTEPGALSELARRRGRKLFEANDHALYALDLDPKVNGKTEGDRENHAQ